MVDNSRSDDLRNHDLGSQDRRTRVRTRFVDVADARMSQNRAESSRAI